MARTFTEYVPLGFKAPEFRLPDAVSGQQIGLSDVKGENATVVMFICNHCPYVIHVRQQLVDIGREYMPKGIGFVAINSNDVDNYPQDDPDHMREMSIELDMPFHYLFDETQDVARSYHAACTPDIAVFDAELKCVYRGQLDDSRPGSGLPVTGKDLRSALEAVLAGEDVPVEQIPSVGCNIKWRP